jgi:hypothetical protein
MLSATPRIKDAEKVVLEYGNTSSHNVRLLMLDWSAYSGDGNGVAPVGWRDWSIKQGAQFKHYNSFRGGSGWHSFYVWHAGIETPVHIGTRNLFTKEKTKLTVQGTSPKFIGSFE